jgi:pyruvate formate lyase activating enzyme
MRIGRRGFLAEAAKAGLAAAAIPPALRVLLDFEEARAAGGTAAPCPVRHGTTLEDGKVQCLVCPMNCILDPGEVCFCRTRMNLGGKLVNNAYGNPCVVRVDPVEKTPLNHFMPGAKALAIATGGCNLRCLYCQNWRESQSEPKDLKNVDLPAGKAVAGAMEQDLRLLCFSYTEPVVYSEYVLDVATRGREEGVRSIMATAAYIEPGPMKELCGAVSGFALALKGFSPDFYRRVCGQKLSPVLKAIETVRASGAWMEITTLVVPTLNDDMALVKEQCRWHRKALGPDVPLHFARFVPEFKLAELPRTPVATLEDCRKIALDEGIRFVYLSNVAPHEGNRTLCPKCGKVLVDRVGFRILTSVLEGGACPGCRTKVPGVWA